MQDILQSPHRFTAVYLIILLPNEKYSLQVLNGPNGYHELTNVSDLLQLMAVGNQAGKTFVWDIGVDDPTKARYSMLLVNIIIIIIIK